MQIVENIQYYCDKKGVTPTVAGKESGAGKELVTNMKRKGTMPSVEKIRLLANYLGVTTSELLGEAVGSSPSGVRIPVLGTIPAGIPLDAIEDILDWEEIPAAWATGDRQYFGLRVRGDSMYPRYLDGDTVILQKETTCESGDDCAVLVNGSEATLKQVMIKGDGSLELRPTNPAYPPRTYSPADIESIPVQIIGVVVELRRKIK
ncbi:LexA family protein [Flavonifractor plautii]|uniref:LexA family protein n=1 Tax=Flavonifractor plautii TaxID=292800 RepID=UPI001FAE9EFF|nr:XRE family transcriptional regulator [Flavonifractor plautii]